MEIHKKVITDYRKRNFSVESQYSPAGDQPQAIEKLSNSILEGNKFNTLRFQMKILKVNLIYEILILKVDTRGDIYK
ncbi:hypothetical protein GCM10012288_06330 [Malaciobacter pacificus]|uniref:hypothetical protein n=1 Tax=Malaciobacter pacificus TaxID=1080223 RepID=UPI00102A48D1|nr:hypothetical protein [Malaciobacter pacificus]GGD35088.1 hypothetical protein GCM10012288_06330 [Malaciobacter pacificus]